jgi:long-chain acyl-CoA synthetase
VNIKFLKEVFSENREKAAFIWREQSRSYDWLLGQIDHCRNILKKNKVLPGEIVAIRADFNPNSVAMLLTLIENRNVVVPLSLAVKTVDEFLQIAQVEKIVVLKEDEFLISHREQQVTHEHLLYLKDKEHPGLILFSSGSTGKSKAAVHDFIPLLEKFKIRRNLLRTITFLLFDHIGGVNTLFYILSNTGTVITVEKRNPEYICQMIEKHQVELLPTSSTFINMILISKAYEKYDISSLKTVTYGTEAMPEQTLKAFNKLFPNIQLKQTYGLSELGILRSKSRSNNSLWMKVGGEDYQTKVVDGILYIKAKSAMLGYLNAPWPFDEEGWFNTQDRVEVEGEWIRVLGRSSDIINVGGQKVYPAEVESVLLEMDNIKEAAVFGKDNPLMGKVVAAMINLYQDEPVSALKKRVRSHCHNRLETYKIPAHIEISNEQQVSDRFKKVR